MTTERLTRLLRLATLRGDRAAITMLRARLASVPWVPSDDAYRMFTVRLAC